MKFLKIKLLTIAMLLSVAAVNADVTTGGKGVFMPVAMNGTAASNMGWSSSIYQHDSDELRACFKLQMEYGESKKKADIGKYFLNSGTNSAIVGPEDTGGTLNDTNIAGVNLLLGNVFKSTITFAPKAQDFVADFGVYVDLSEWLDGLYFTGHLPFQHARWNLDMTEVVAVATPAASGTNTYEDAATSAIGGNAVTAFKGQTTFDDASVKWSYGKVDGHQTKTRPGDVNLTLGYNFISKEHCHLGLGVTGILGGGGKTTAEYMFEPVIGYAGRFGVGGTLDGGCRLWDKDDENQIVVNTTIYAAHLFDNEQRRSYDLTDSGDMSRYLLVKKMDGAHSYNGILDNMINIGSLKAKIGVDVVYNGNITFCWQMGNVSVDFGYQVAGHGKEKHKVWVDSIPALTYTLFDLTTTNASAAHNAIGVSQISISGDETSQTTATVGAANASTYYITEDSLNKNSGLMKSAVEHTLFAGLNYMWSDNEWMPGVGLLGSYHIAGSDNNTFDRWTVGLQFNFCV